jgi:hypothetical protein
MNNDEDDDSELWDEDSEDSQPVSKEYVEEQIQKMLRRMEEKAKQKLHYLESEGFVQKTEIPGVYEYTPEGLVIVREQYKKMMEDM